MNSKGNSFSFINTLNRIEGLMAALAAVATLFMAAIVFLDVTLRFFLNRPIQGTYETGEFMMIFVVYLSVAYVQSEKGHIKIEIFTGNLNQMWKTLLDVFGNMVGLIIFTFATWSCGMAAWEAWSTGDYTMGLIQFPYWPFKSVLTFGLALLCLRLMVDIYRDVIILIGKDERGIHNK